LPIQRDDLDIPFVKRRVENCQAYHDMNCSPIKQTPVNLRVIDCLSGQVVDAPELCQYTAMSYVWSQCEQFGGGPEHRSSILEQLPRLMKDCVKLTIKPDYRYLWCDRYCIDQSDERQLSFQIRQMDSVYANAEVTIVAAAYIDGLPGI
ncbi:HET-domain-containing protein, partial [Bimuria novae-zelandiae CBS 107.79]